ncbi:MAG: hypothetical protein ACK58T_19945, partial [Phycisphaerae bacterium]
MPSRQTIVHLPGSGAKGHLADDGDRSTFQQTPVEQKQSWQAFGWKFELPVEFGTIRAASPFGRHIERHSPGFPQHV